MEKLYGELIMCIITFTKRIFTLTVKTVSSTTDGPPTVYELSRKTC